MQKSTSYLKMDNKYNNVFCSICTRTHGTEPALNILEKLEYHNARDNVRNPILKTQNFLFQIEIVKKNYSSSSRYLYTIICPNDWFGSHFLSFSKNHCPFNNSYLVDVSTLEGGVKIVSNSVTWFVHGPEFQTFTMDMPKMAFLESNISLWHPKSTVTL